MRLIDAEQLYEKTAEWEAEALAQVARYIGDEENISEWMRWTAILGERTAFKHDVADAPTVEPEPKIGPGIAVGRWISISNGRIGFECSCCHNYAPSHQNGVEYLSKFCPQCGTKMEQPCHAYEPDEGEEEEEREGANMKIYISGTTTDQYYKERVKEAERFIESLHAEPVNPAETPEGGTYKWHIDAGLSLLKECDAILMLPEWKLSKGAKLERLYASTVGMPVLETVRVNGKLEFCY